MTMLRTARMLARHDGWTHGIGPEYGNRVSAVLDSLGILPELITARSLVLCEEAGDLVTVEIDGNAREHRLVPAAAIAWRAMRAAALSDDITLEIVSAFRSVEHQAKIIRRKLQAGLSLPQILTVNAPPGFSEHHTGRAIDITTPGAKALENEFDGTLAFQWLSGNATSFGFTLSYPRNNQHGYLYEPWHWCYRASAA
jgi:D-alanyl-D-alanine carboxypeptidase